MTIEGVIATASGLLLGAVLVGVGLVTIAVVVNDGIAKLQDVGCAFGAIGLVLVGGAIAATALGADIGALLGVAIPQRDIERVVLAVLSVVMFTIGVGVWVHPGPFTPTEAEMAHGSLIESMLAFRPLEAVINSILRPLPPKVVVRVGATLYLAFAALLFVGITDPAVPTAVVDTMAGLESTIGLAFLVVLSLGVLGAIAAALLRGRRGLREAAAFAVIWLATLFIALLAGWLDGPLSLVPD